MCIKFRIPGSIPSYVVFSIAQCKFIFLKSFIFVLTSSHESKVNVSSIWDRTKYEVPYYS